MVEYNYLDGSANSYIITKNTISYHPMTPDRSSSGTYSVGDPWTVNIDEEAFKRLEGLFKKSIENKKDQIKDRNMGTGLLIVKPSNKEYIFDMGSVQQNEIEESLDSYRPN